jgi:hypothetical protein
LCAPRQFLAHFVVKFNTKDTKFRLEEHNTTIVTCITSWPFEWVGRRQGRVGLGRRANCVAGGDGDGHADYKSEKEASITIVTI